MITNPNNIQKLEYSTVEFNLSNATYKSVTVDLFDAVSLTNTPSIDATGAFPNNLGQQINVGNGYIGIAVDELRKNIITGNQVGDVKVINASSRETLFSTKSTIGSFKMLYIQQKDLAYSISGGDIAVINPINGEEEVVVNLGVGLNFTDLTYCPNSGVIYIQDGGLGQKLWFFNTANNTNIGSFQPPALSRVTNITYASSNDSIYMYDTAHKVIYQFSCTSNSLVDTIALSVGVVPIIGTYNSPTNQIYFQDKGEILASPGFIRILDVSTNTVIFPFIAGFSGIISDITSSSIANHIYVVHKSSASIKVIDGVSNTVVNTLVVATGWGGNIVYSDSLNTVYSTPRTLFIAQYVQEIVALGSQFYIIGSSDYNIFVRDTLINPKFIDRIMIYAEDNKNLINPLDIKKQDANGNECNLVRLPNITVSSNQFQGQIGQVDFKNFILDVTASIGYTIPPFTLITWVIYYKELTRSDLLTGRTMIESFDAHKAENTDTYDEAYIEVTRLKPSFERNKVLN